MRPVRVFDCTKCSLLKECDECEMKHKTYLCDVMGCFFFVNRGKVTEIKMEEKKNSWKRNTLNPTKYSLLEAKSV